ncbi:MULTISPECIES: glycosyl hydrolase family 8 [Rhizobium]|uniref:Glucanase n=1 Tax=Rhizobium miluonense TaxID=411945 RepID=A0A1C3WRZ4_9HYPH|nr:glycosyl hydrolase family 8 [Rhizobium miluonense]SCB42514.1 Endo-1,4-beta-D-glucanase Y [Rhizobium miluonense]
MKIGKSLYTLLMTLPPALGISAGDAQSAEGIRPTGFTQQQLDQSLVDFYKKWRSTYLVQDCGSGRYYVGVTADGKSVGGGTAKSTITVSEAHGYGMLISVLMADFDPAAHAVFDGMVHYFHDHPAKSGPGLMAWNQTKGCGNAREVAGDHSATDGDLDIAYALLLADRKWGSDGNLNYRKEALKVIASIGKHEIDADSRFVRIGDWVDDADEMQYAPVTRSSDFMVSHFKAFAGATGDRTWYAVRDETYSIIDKIRSKYSSQTALMPDFIVGLPTAPRPAGANFLEGPNDGAYSWNAARYPWRIAVDYLLNDDQRALAALRPLNSWIKRATNGDPANIAGTYKLSGNAVAESGRGAMAFVSMFAVSASIEATNQNWLDALWTDMTKRTVENADYYGNTLKLLAMITITGHWRQPNP